MGGSKTQNGCFPSKIAHRLKKVCYKVSLCENCRRQSCKAFIGLNRSFTVAGAHLRNNLPLHLHDSELTLLELCGLPEDATVCEESWRLLLVERLINVFTYLYTYFPVLVIR